jgi:pimeloyl-ACP methyl ester carboxylesterase
MNKKIKKILTVTVLTGGAIYAFNKFIDYAASSRGLTLDENENYYAWRNGTIFYQKKGTGSPILLIHDLNPLSSSYEWSHVIDKLSENHSVYAVDLLGCGKSEKPSTTYVNYIYVQLINDFIQDVIQEKTDLVVTGASFSFAVMAARMNETQIGKITAINPDDISSNVQSPTKISELAKHVLELPIIGTFIYNLTATTRNIQQEFENAYYYDIAKIPVNMPDIYYESAHLQGSNGKYLYASMLGNYTNINIIHALKLIKNPIHFILTDESSEAIAYQNYNDAITIDYIDEAGYLPQLEQPEETIKLITK